MVSMRDMHVLSLNVIFPGQIHDCRRFQLQTTQSVMGRV